MATKRSIAEVDKDNPYDVHEETTKRRKIDAVKDGVYITDDVENKFKGLLEMLELNENKKDKHYGTALNGRRQDVIYRKLMVDEGGGNLRATYIGTSLSLLLVANLEDLKECKDKLSTNDKHWLDTLSWVTKAKSSIPNKEWTMATLMSVLQGITKVLCEGPEKQVKDVHAARDFVVYLSRSFLHQDISNRAIADTLKKTFNLTSDVTDVQDFICTSTILVKGLFTADTESIKDLAEAVSNDIIFCGKLPRDKDNRLLRNFLLSLYNPNLCTKGDNFVDLDIQRRACTWEPRMKRR